VAEFVLTARPALNGYNTRFEAVDLREVTDLAIVSMAIPLAGEQAFSQALKAAFGIALPEVGNSHVCRDGVTRIMRLGQDQLFALFAHDGADAAQVVDAKLGGMAYLTDQSDVWVALELSGVRARRVLERIAMVDLHGDVFGVGALARTSMQHLGTIIIRTGPDVFLLLSAASSARSFLHGIEVSIKNTEAPTRI